MIRIEVDGKTYEVTGAIAWADGRREKITAVKVGDKVYKSKEQSRSDVAFGIAQWSRSKIIDKTRVERND